MKLPWDKKYLKISLHVIFSISMLYVIFYLIDFLFNWIFNIDILVGNVSDFIGYLGMVFQPLIIAFLIAYILDPIVDKFQTIYENTINKSHDHEKQTKQMIKNFKREQEQIEDSIDKKSGFVFKPRSEGTAITYALLAVIIGVIIYSTITTVTRKSEEVIISSEAEISEELQIDDIEDTTLIEDIMIAVYGIFDEYMDDFREMEETIQKLGLSDTANEYLEDFGSFISNLSKTVINIIISIGSGIATLFIALVLAFYMMRDKEKFKHNSVVFLDTFTPKKVSEGLKNFGTDLHAIFSGYLRGQLTDATIIGFLLGLSLSIIGIPFAWFIGIFSGFSNLIPYIGAIVGLILAVISGLLSGNPILAVYAVIIILIIQQLDTIYISPKFVGQSVELSPFLVILSLSVAGSIFGLMGMVLAVPVTAMAKILIVRFVARNKGKFVFSQLYDKIQKIGHQE